MILSLAEKQKAFQTGSLRVQEFIGNRNAAVAKLQHDPVSLKYAFFEQGVALHSPTVANKPSVFMGAYSYMNDGGYMRSNVFVGRFCSIGRRVTIGAGGHHMSTLSTSPILSSGTTEQNYVADEIERLGLRPSDKVAPMTILESDIWVGDGVVIMPGVTIGIGAVIGANAVVTRDVEPYSIVAGLPAKKIRRRFPDDICEALIRSEWWEYPVPALRRMGTGNVMAFLTSLERQKEEKEAYMTFGFQS